MRAVIYKEFQTTPEIKQVADPSPTASGVVLKVKATGICRSDWHGWMGHDQDIVLPHVPGHELAGVVAAVGKHVQCWRVGDRVTLPFVGGCGTCGQCLSGNHQVCDAQFQPGFTHWGSFAEYVAIDYADINLVGIPEAIDFVTAASLGCRFATSYRAVVAQAQVKAGEWVAVFGCGGVGLSAVMIADALGARVIAIDVSDPALTLAESVGAAYCIKVADSREVVAQVKQLTDGGADVSIDALGSQLTCHQSISCLKKRGKHIQVGLITEQNGNAIVPMAQVIANELEILGSHGMQAHRYGDMLTMIEQDQLQPQQLIQRCVNLEQSIKVLTNMNKSAEPGITMIDVF